MGTPGSEMRAGRAVRVRGRADKWPGWCGARGTRGRAGRGGSAVRSAGPDRGTVAAGVTHPTWLRDAAAVCSARLLDAPQCVRRPQPRCPPAAERAGDEATGDRQADCQQDGAEGDRSLERDVERLGRRLPGAAGEAAATAT